MDASAQTYSVKGEEKVAKHKIWEVQLKEQKKGKRKKLPEDKWTHGGAVLWGGLPRMRSREKRKFRLKRPPWTWQFKDRQWWNHFSRVPGMGTKLLWIRVLAEGVSEWKAQMLCLGSLEAGTSRHVGPGDRVKKKQSTQCLFNKNRERVTTYPVSRLFWVESSAVLCSPQK